MQCGIRARLSVTAVSSFAIGDRPSCARSGHTHLWCAFKPHNTPDRVFCWFCVVCVAVLVGLQVEWWDTNDNRSPPSEAGEFHIGPINETEWSNANAKWIGSSDNRGNMFRKEVTLLDLPIKRAHAYVAGLFRLLACS